MSAPYLIAIAGMSCSGKSTLAKALASRLPATIFRIDEYYLNLDHLPPEERARYDFDSPQALDQELIMQHIRELAAGREIQQPVYDFTRHTRTDRTTVLRPNEFIIVEGLFTLYWEPVRALYRTKVFMNAGHDVCLPRRKTRDIVERGRTAESVIEQYAATVRPGADAYVLPSRSYADLVLDGTQPVELSAEAVLQHIAKYSV
jgi:uridine kinase